MYVHVIKPDGTYLQFSQYLAMHFTPTFELILRVFPLRDQIFCVTNIGLQPEWTAMGRPLLHNIPCVDACKYSD